MKRLNERMINVRREARVKETEREGKKDSVKSANWTSNRIELNYRNPITKVWLQTIVFLSKAENKSQWNQEHRCVKNLMKHLGCVWERRQDCKLQLISVFVKTQGILSMCEWAH